MIIFASRCVEGNHGPRCELCINDDQYFSNSDGICIDCPSLSRLPILGGIILGVGMIIFASRTAYLRCAINLLHKLVSFTSSHCLQTKLKILISFFQVVSTLKSVYGVQLDSQLWSWMKFLEIVNFNILELAIPQSCIGSMYTRIMISATLPYFLIILAVLGVFLCAVGVVGMAGIKNDFQKFWNRILYATILILYLVLPSVSSSIFSARKCEVFITNDKHDLLKSYLIEDLSIECGINDSDDYSSLLRLFWILFVCWPILVPMVFAGLLKRIHRTVYTNHTTALAEACRFLWKDYNESIPFWDIIDIMRKIFLTGFIMFVDPEEGSTRVLRLILATVVSSVYISVLSYVRPFKRHDDFQLAIVSNILLVCIFSLGIVIQLCDDDNDGICKKTIGFSITSFKATLIAVVLTLVMLVITMISFVVVRINEISAPTICLAATGYVPNLELPKNKEYHAFLSHVWKSGQGKTHAIVRKLQLYIPGIKIWLDVDDLENISALEKSVANCSVLIIFYSEGYFQSKNCRRELYAAVSQNKPLLVLHESSDNTVETIKEECEEYCTDASHPATVSDFLCAAEYIS